MSLVFYQRLSGGLVACYLQCVDTGEFFWRDLPESEFQQKFGG